MNTPFWTWLDGNESLASTIERLLRGFEHAGTDAVVWVHTDDDDEAGGFDHALIETRSAVHYVERDAEPERGTWTRTDVARSHHLPAAVVENVERGGVLAVAGFRWSDMHRRPGGDEVGVHDAAAADRGDGLTLRPDVSFPALGDGTPDDADWLPTLAKMGLGASLSAAERRDTAGEQPECLRPATPDAPGVPDGRWPDDPSKGEVVMTDETLHVFDGTAWITVVGRADDTDPVDAADALDTTVADWSNGAESGPGPSPWPGEPEPEHDAEATVGSKTEYAKCVEFGVEREKPRLRGVGARPDFSLTPYHPDPDPDPDPDDEQVVYGFGERPDVDSDPDGGPATVTAVPVDMVMEHNGIGGVSVRVKFALDNPSGVAPRERKYGVEVRLTDEMVENSAEDDAFAVALSYAKQRVAADLDAPVEFPDADPFTTTDPDD